MYRSITRIPAFLALGLMVCAPATAEEKTSSASERYTLAPDDPDYEAMPNAKGKDEVYAYCSACHSMKLVVQQNLSRDRWDHLLDWMVEEQGMAPLAEADRKLVLDYLAEHYGSDSGADSPGQ